MARGDRGRRRQLPIVIASAGVSVSVHSPVFSSTLRSVGRLGSGPAFTSTWILESWNSSKLPFV